MCNACCGQGEIVRPAKRITFQKVTRVFGERVATTVDYTVPQGPDACPVCAERAELEYQLTVTRSSNGKALGFS